jgi:hypothetical protein
MSRSGYSDDIDDQWALIRWRGAVASAFRGTRGQDFLKEMVDALDALPRRRLVANELEIRADVPDVCALGAVGVARRVNMSGIDPENYSHVAGVFGVAECMAQEIVYVNDEYGYRDTPEQRWLRMRRYIVSQIKGWYNPESDLMLDETG